MAKNFRFARAAATIWGHADGALPAVVCFCPAKCLGGPDAIKSAQSCRNLLQRSLAVLLICLCRPSFGLAQAETPARPPSAAHRRVPNPFPKRIDLPADLLDGGHGWLNVSGPIELKDLRGKIVLIDFWTYCCINCMHILPDLKFLEHKYPRELVVIGVHSAKFVNERDSENIRRAIVRYEIEHPVLNDSDLAVWTRTGVNSWPTLALIDPEGKLVRAFSGEGHRAALDADIAKLVAITRGTALSIASAGRFRPRTAHKLADHAAAIPRARCC